MSNGSKYILNDFVSYRNVEDEIVILNISTDYFYLLSTATAKAVFKSIIDGLLLEDIIKYVREEFFSDNLSDEKIKEDIISFTQSLLDEKIIRYSK